jgi:hypothetical protein
MSAAKASIYSAAEHRVISEWLGVDPLEPIEPVRPLWQAIRSLGVRHAPDNERQKIGAAVAKIVLANFESRLPLWAGEGLPSNNRSQLEMPPRGLLSRSHRRVAIAPRLICEINWVFSGPSIPWPSAYHLSYLPLYNHFVVTESRDTDEVDGYYDFAIGHFPVDKDITSECERIIEAAWRWAKWEGNREEWLAVHKPGILTADRAYELRQQVWQIPAKTQEVREREQIAIIEKQTEKEGLLPLREHVMKAKFETPFVGTLTGWSRNARRDRIFRYVKEYHRAQGELPTGKHCVGSFDFEWTDVDT